MVGITIIPRPGAKDIIIYRPPAHASNPIFGVYAKSRSFPKGPVPAHLEPYKGQAREAPKRCKGKKGQEYRMCLIKETAGLRKRR